MSVVRPFPASRHLAAIALTAVACAAGAQPVYRIVGPDGKVTFSDQPPPAGTKASQAPVVPLAGAAGGDATLPFELRSVASRYPVTLYTSPDCRPCGAARAYLASRGVPFTEKTVSTNEDVAALRRLSGGTNLPFLTIGGQQLTGFSESEWAQFLDAARYPRTSQLPPGYRQPAATPLVVATRPKPVEQAPSPAPRPAAPAPAPAPAGDNPAGISF